MNDQLDWMVSRARAGRMSRREFLGRSSALGLGTALASALYTGAARAGEPKKGGLLRAGISGGGSTDSLDPALAVAIAANMTNCIWGERLVEVTADKKIDLRLCEDMSSSPDAKVWSFKMRQGVTFHNGQPVTAEDVVATFRRHSDENSKSGALGMMRNIADMKAEGDMVVLTVESASADLPYLLGDFHLQIQPGGGFDGPTAGIGAGPYKVEVFEPGVRVGFTKFADYFDPNTGHADQVEMLIINDNTARTSALQAGQIHMMNRIDPKIADILKDSAGVQIKNTAGSGHYVFIMHCDTPPFDNNDLRMALKLAIRRDEMVEKVLGGLGTIGNDFPINATYAFFDDSIPQREYDAAAAAEYYKKSGHDGSPIVLRTAYGAFPGAVDAANLFAASAQAAGIPLEIKLEPDDGYWENVWNVAPFCASYWSGSAVQDRMYTQAYLSTADWNDTRFKNAEFDELLIQARGELDPGKRKDEYSRMAHLLRDEGGLILPMFNDFVDGIRDEVGGWYSDPNSEMMGYRALSRCWLNG